MARKANPSVKPQPARTPPIWIPFALAAAVFLVYWPVAGFQFVNYDDTDFVTANPIVQKGLTVEGFKWVWHSEVARNWHPITMLTHMLDCQLFGVHAGGHHLTNLLIHVANTLLLYSLLRYLTGAIWRSAFVAALFGLHPLHVESVAWIAERKDVLSTFFWFLSIWAYACYCRRPKGGIKFYAASIALFGLGLMSKPMLVTGPFVLLLLDYWPLNRMQPFRVKLIWEKLPFLAMSAALCVITYSIQQHGGAMLNEQNLPLASRVENALISYWRYIGKMFWPQNLAGLYLRSGQWPLWLAALAALVLLAVSIMVILRARGRAWLPVGWFWYLGTLVPVIGLVQVGMQTMADRFSYVPLIGVFIILTWGGVEVARARHLPDSTLALASVFVLTACMVLTFHQVFFWRDSETLFKRMIAATPNNFMAHYNLANLYSKQGRVQLAKENYEAALREEPNYAEAHNNYGNLFLDQKRYEQAIEQYAAAIRVNGQPLYYLNYANALADAASARHDTNEFAAAVRAYEQAIQVDPGSSEAHCNLGLTWDAQGRESEAAAEFREAIRLKPDYEMAHFNLGNALSRLHELDQAGAEYRVAAQLNPARPETHQWLAMCYVMQNKMPEAEEQFKAVIRLQPDNAAAEGNLGNTLAAQNKLDEAITHYLSALRLAPGDYQTEFNLGLTLARSGKPAEAEGHYQQALRINPNYAEARQALKELHNSVNTQK